jgi:hypothetical protein
MSEAGDMPILPTPSGLVPGRECGSCTLCCKIFRIAEVESAPGEWCKNCAPGKGCMIHAVRPAVCHNYFCSWMFQPGLGPEWKPEKSKIILNVELNGQRLAAHIDPGSPGAWRRSPYYESLKRWSADALMKQQQVSVWIGQHCIVILPDKDIDLGLIAADEMVVSTTKMTPHGAVHGAEKMKRSEAAARAQRWAAAKAQFELPKGETAGRA